MIENNTKIHTRHVIWLTCFVWIIMSGCQSEKKISVTENTAATIQTLAINSTPDYYDVMIDSLNNPTFVILKEDDATMYSDITKIIDTSERYFIIDSWGARKVAAFDHYGKPLTAFGRRGNGPGEYITPTDLTVDSNFVYILDNAGQSIIKYDYSGNYISKKAIPFYASAFCSLGNGNFIFHLDYSENTPWQLCITDSTYAPLSMMIPYPKGFVSSPHTKDALCKTTSKGITFYASPSDTIYNIDDNGSIYKKTALRYDCGPIDEVAKRDYNFAFEQGLLEDKGMTLSENPMVTSDGISYCRARIKDKSYLLIYNEATGESGVRKFGDRMSSFSLITPAAVDRKGKLISYISPEIIDYLDDFDQLPDSIKTALEDGNRILQIF